MLWPNIPHTPTEYFIYVVSEIHLIQKQLFAIDDDDDVVPVCL